MPDPKPEQAPEDFTDVANRSVAAGIADETAGYDKALTATEGRGAEDESEAQPS